MESTNLLKVHELPTAPIEGQKPGTSGLRKQTRVFREGYYLHNFVQSLFNALPADEIKGATLVVSGDGRFFVKEAIQTIIRIAAAHGIGRIWVGKDGLLSTPAVSTVIREREDGIAYGGIVLTASHNPGGPDADFGIKYNTGNGGPAPESVTDAIFEETKNVTVIKSCEGLPPFDLSTIGRQEVKSSTGESFVVEVIDPVEDCLKLLREVFDFPKLKSFVSRPDFSMLYDGMNGVAGIYATRILGQELGLNPSNMINCTPLEDFGGVHPDPNLTYAPFLVKSMGLDRNGIPLPRGDNDPPLPYIGTAQDGDADRNMILGAQFFVTPSDSVAIIAAYADAIPYFANAGGLKGCARSMPTSQALDKVAQAKGIPFFEVPTGWKFFGNLMDSHLQGKDNYCPFLCGEESFGTGSSHVREKDGLWAVLAWLSIAAHVNADSPVGQLVSIEEIVRNHWKQYGRNYYCRFDYEGVETDNADAFIQHLRGKISEFQNSKEKSSGGKFVLPWGNDGLQIEQCDEFSYADPVDGSVTSNQGIRFIFTTGERVIVRLSGTGSAGATIRVYLEKYENDPQLLDMTTRDVLVKLTKLVEPLVEQFTGRKEPTVIT